MDGPREGLTSGHSGHNWPQENNFHVAINLQVLTALWASGHNGHMKSL